jgi:hypothetical protein
MTDKSLVQLRDELIEAIGELFCESRPREPLTKKEHIALQKLLAQHDEEVERSINGNSVRS